MTLQWGLIGGGEDSWTSAVAIGRAQGLTIEVYGEMGGLRWQQEHPNQLYWTALGAPTTVIERGAPGLSAEADRATHVAIGHAGIAAVHAAVDSAGAGGAWVKLSHVPSQAASRGV